MRIVIQNCRSFCLLVIASILSLTSIFTVQPIAQGSGSPPAVEQPAQDFEDQPSQKPNEEMSVPGGEISGEILPLLHDYQIAISKSKELKRPLLVIFGAEWCGPCKLLEKELESPEAESIFKTWVVAKIDVDEQPELAEQFAASSIPALRILDAQEDIIDQQEGFSSMPKLIAWLDQARQSADPHLLEILRDKKKMLNEEEIRTACRLLNDRSKNLRIAIVETLIRNRQSQTEVVNLFQSGTLSQRLAAKEVLKKWNAPVDEFDPWEPESFDASKLESLKTWCSSNSPALESN